MAAPKAGHPSSVLLLVGLAASLPPLAELCCPGVPREGLMASAAEGFSQLMRVLILKELF